MENRNTQTATRQNNINTLENFDGGGELAEKRLNTLLTLNAEIADEKALYVSEREKLESEMIKNPLSSEKAFSYLGLLLGTFPPAAIFTKFFIENGSLRSDEFWIIGVLAIVNLISAVVGFFSGKLIGKMVRETEKISWGRMLILLPFIGMLWGIMSGGAGGIIIFIIGALFGAYFGAIVGSIALPIFTIFHRLLKKGDFIERNQFLPIAFGITFVICGLILGL
jgi:MFS family permease